MTGRNSRNADARIGDNAGESAKNNVPKHHTRSKALADDSKSCPPTLDMSSTSTARSPECDVCLALRPKDAARALGIGERKLWEITADRTSGIPHVRLGKAILYPIRELRDWLAQQANPRKEVKR